MIEVPLLLPVGFFFSSRNRFALLVTVAGNDICLKSFTSPIILFFLLFLKTLAFILLIGLGFLSHRLSYSRANRLFLSMGFKTSWRSSPQKTCAIIPLISAEKSSGGSKPSGGGMGPMGGMGAAIAGAKLKKAGGDPAPPHMPTPVMLPPMGKATAPAPRPALNIPPPRLPSNSSAPFVHSKIIKDIISNACVTKDHVAVERERYA